MAAVVVVAWVIIVHTDEVARTLARLAGAIVCPVLAAVTWRALRSRPRRWLHGVAAAVGSLIGLALTVEPERYQITLTRAAGVLLVLIATGLEVHARRASDDRPAGVAHGSAAASGLAGVAFVALPVVSFDAVVWLIVVLAAARMLLRAAIRMGAVDLEVVAGRSLLLGWLDDKRRSADDRGAIYEQVFLEGRDGPARFARYVLLMAFASIISAMGVLTESTAVVIGAMLIAPLMNPMMGMGLSLTMGWPNRLRRSAVIVLLGAAIAVLAGWFFAAGVDIPVDLGSNGEVLSRTSPTVGDLVIAIAAGGAGAYALSRRDVSSSLPGVAVAIALVPPLSVIGITANTGAWDEARGTLLLFLTNFVAIVLVSGLVFTLTGIAPIRKLAHNQVRVRTAAAGIVALGIIVVGALVFNGNEIARNALTTSNARRTVVDWLGPETEFTVESVEVDGDDVDVRLIGPGEPPPERRLARMLGQELDHEVVVTLRWTQQQLRTASAS